jgi:hypothetical protein
MNAFRRKMGLRIDHVLLSPALAPRAPRAPSTSSRGRLERPSDHAPWSASSPGHERPVQVPQSALDELLRRAIDVAASRSAGSRSSMGRERVRAPRRRELHGASAERSLVLAEAA